MRINPRTSLLLVSFCCCRLFAKAQTDTNIVADGATPQLISRDFKFTEGPAPDKKGNIYFTDQPNNKIWIYKTDGSLSLSSIAPVAQTDCISTKKATCFPAPMNKCNFGQLTNIRK